MELSKANRIISSVRASMRMDGYSVSPALQTLGGLMLLNVNTPEESMEKIGSSPYKSTASIFFRLLSIVKMPTPLYFDIETLQFLHRTLYADLRPDPGSLRKINISKNGASCIDYKLLPASLRAVLDQLKKKDPGKTVTKNDFAAYLAYFMREMLILSPFPYGNGLTLRLFFELYSASRGFLLDYNKCDYKEFSAAETVALAADDVQPLYKCLVKCLSYLRFIPSQKRADIKDLLKTGKGAGATVTASAARPVTPKERPAPPPIRDELERRRKEREAMLKRSIERSARLLADDGPEADEKPETTVAAPKAAAENASTRANPVNAATRANPVNAATRANSANAATRASSAAQYRELIEKRRLEAEERRKKAAKEREDALRRRREKLFDNRASTSRRFANGSRPSRRPGEKSADESIKVIPAKDITVEMPSTQDKTEDTSRGFSARSRTVTVSPRKITVTEKDRS